MLQALLAICLCPSSVNTAATFGSLSVSILCKCCSHFWQSVCVLPLFMLRPLFLVLFSFPLLCSVLPFFPLTHRFLSLSSFVIPSKCLKNFICAASKRCSSLFFSTQTSLPNVKLIAFNQCKHFWWHFVHISNKSSNSLYNYHLITLVTYCFYKLHDIWR